MTPNLGGNRSDRLGLARSTDPYVRLGRMVMTMAQQALLTRPVDVLLIEPHEICRRALMTLAAEGGSFRIAAEASTLHEVEGATLLRDPEVILYAGRGTDLPGALEALERRYPSGRVLVMASSEDGETAFKAVRGGAAGLVAESSSPDEIREAILALSRGETVFDPALSAEALLWAARNDGLKSPSARNGTPLTPRESEVVGMLAEGLSAAGIASRLSLSRRTVEAHLANAYRKLGVHGRIEALREYQRLTAAPQR